MSPADPDRAGHDLAGQCAGATRAAGRLRRPGRAGGARLEDPRAGDRRRQGRRRGLRERLRRPPARGSGARRRAHAVRRRVHHQGDDRRCHRHARRRGQARLGRPGDETPALVRARGSVCHPRGADPRSAHPSRRRAQHRPAVVRAADPGPPDHRQSPRGAARELAAVALHLPERDVRRCRRGGGGGQRHAVERVRARPHLRAPRHERHAADGGRAGRPGQRRRAALRHRRHGDGDSQRQRRRRGAGRVGLVERARHGASGCGCSSPAAPPAAASAC